MLSWGLQSSLSEQIARCKDEKIHIYDTITLTETLKCVCNYNMLLHKNETKQKSRDKMFLSLFEPKWRTALRRLDVVTHCLCAIHCIRQFLNILSIGKNKKNQIIHTKNKTIY